MGLKSSGDNVFAQKRKNRLYLVHINPSVRSIPFQILSTSSKYDPSGVDLKAPRFLFLLEFKELKLYVGI